MIGSVVDSPYRSVSDFWGPQDYINYMFGGKLGYFSRNQLLGKRMKQTFAWSYNMANRFRWRGEKDCYISQNSFRSPFSNEDPGSGRKVSNLQRLNALYVDIDCYKQGLTPEQVLYFLEEDCFDHTIPLPTFVIDSGRGMYLIWKVDEDGKALTRWQSVENYLISQCTEYGADPQASDAARILRVPGTINSKSGKPVRIMRFNNVSYSLREIIREFDVQPVRSSRKRVRPDGLPTYPYGHATERQRRLARWIATELGIDLPDFTDFAETAQYISTYQPRINAAVKQSNRKNAKTLNLGNSMSIKGLITGRMADLRRLFSRRKGADCGRELALFLTRLWTLDLYGDPKLALEQTLNFNAALDCPFDAAYVEKATQSAETKHKAGQTYHYSTKKLISILSITEEEQKGLEYLCGYSLDARKRKREANHRAYLSRLEKENKDTKQSAIHDRRQNIATLLVQGKSKVEICHTLNIASRTFDRDKAAIVAQGLIEKIKEAMAAAANKAVKAKKAVWQGVKVIAGAASALRRGSPFFQHPYYKTTSVACPVDGDNAIKMAVGVSGWFPGGP